MVRVGDVVVVFLSGVPVAHNSREFPDHPCRGRVLAVGRKLVKVSTIGAPLRVPFSRALPVEEAKVAYRRVLEENPSWRTPAFIDACVASL